MEFVGELTIWNAVLIVMVAIILDAVLGVIKTFKKENENFDIRKLPQFMATNIFPYVGSLAVVAVSAEFIGKPFDIVFYALAVPVVAKYVADIKDKLQNIFGVDVNV